MTSHRRRDVITRHLGTPLTAVKNFEESVRSFSPLLLIRESLKMSKSEEMKRGDECSTEAYGDDDIILGGACAADTFAGPGQDEWAPKAHARRAGFSTKGKSAKSDSDLSRRVRQLEKELRKRQTRGRKSKKTSRNKKGRSAGSSSDSADSSTGSRDESSSSSTDSARRSPDKSKDKKPKYDRRRQLKKGESLKNATSLIVYLVKLLQKSYKKGKRVKGLISHLLVMAEKVESGYYKFECLVGYDDECREVASEKGMGSFGEIRPAAVLRFLSYDSTASARRQQSQGGQQSQLKKHEARGFCFKFNASGCNSANCQFRHVCMFCGESGHGSQTCRKGKAGSTGGKGN